LIGRQCRFRALFIAFFKAVSADSGTISATKAADCFSYGERFTTTIPLHVVTKLTVTIVGHSLAYKSQRKKMKRKKKRAEQRRRRQREGEKEDIIEKERGETEGKKKKKLREEEKE